MPSGEKPSDDFLKLSYLCERDSVLSNVVN